MCAGCLITRVMLQTSKAVEKGQAWKRTRLLLHEVFPLVVSDHHSEDPTVFLIIIDGGICFFFFFFFNFCQVTRAHCLMHGHMIESCMTENSMYILSVVPNHGFCHIPPQIVLQNQEQTISEQFIPSGYEFLSQPRRWHYIRIRLWISGIFLMNTNILISTLVRRSPNCNK